MSEWSKTPPSEPGWYWWTGAMRGMSAPEVVCLYRAIGGCMKGRLVVDWAGVNERDPADEAGGEWWTTRIEEPPR